MVPTKPLATQRELSLAYTPGWRLCARRSRADPSTARRFTAKGNLVAVITNGTAVLGLGNIGPLAAAGDGRQRCAVQEIRRHRCVRH